MPIDLGPLLTIKVPTPAIKPVGITPAITVDGKIATQTQGRGDGIFKDIVSKASILYSTFKDATSTPSSNPAMNAGNTVGTGNFNDPASDKLDGKSAFMTLLLILVGAKLLKLF